MCKYSISNITSKKVTSSVHNNETNDEINY